MPSLARPRGGHPWLIAFGPWLLLEALAWSLGQARSKGRDLARVEIDQPQPPPATLRLGWSQRTDVRRETVLLRASADLGYVAGVAALRRPRVMAVLTVLPKPGRHPFVERRQAVAVPILKASLLMVALAVEESLKSGRTVSLAELR
jgi:hypothetical protein